MFNEKEHPRGQPNNSGQFVKKNEKTTDELKADLAHEIPDELLPVKSAASKMTPAEKIASVHIDFSKDNILPELNESELEKVGAKTNKSILLKKSVIDRNRAEHSDITDNDFEQIVAKALYAPSEVFPANKDKPYYHFAKVVEVNSKGKPEIGLALLDVDDTKDNFEVVHAHFVGTKAFERAKKKD